MPKSLILSVLLLSCASTGSAPEISHREWIEAREASLRNPDGYLGLAGLFWLQEGGQTIGSNPENDLVFPAGRAPESLGEITLEKGVITVKSGPHEGLYWGGAPVAEIKMIPDTEGEATRLRAGKVVFWAIERSGRYGIRLRDPQSEVLRNYQGTERFDYDPAWVITGRFEASEPGTKISVPNILGSTYSSEAPGKIFFEHGGEEFSLLSTDENDTEYFFVFGDRTNGGETYGGGRFLKVKKPLDGSGTVRIDFNRSYNPPCAYSPFTTCPLPPKGNRLPFAVSAGEKNPPKSSP